jgi:hypothetical protein
MIRHCGVGKPVGLLQEHYGPDEVSVYQFFSRESSAALSELIASFSNWPNLL